MFNRRLLIFALLVALGALVVLARLAQMQLVHGADYARDAEQAMIRTRWLATARGDILDRHGRILAVDQPCYEFTMEYPALLTSWAARQTRRWSEERGLSPEQAVEQVAARLDDHRELTLMTNWAQRQAKALARREGVGAEQVLPTLAERIEWTLDSAAGIAGADRAELDRQIDRIVARVWQIRSAVKMLVEEETAPHAVITALDESTATALRRQLEHMLGAEVAPSTRRWYPYGPAGAHVIGLTALVDANDVGMVWRRPDAPSDGALPRLDALPGASDPPAASEPFADDDAWPEAAEIAGFDRMEARPEGQPGHERDLLARYRPGERLGVMGVERMAEPVLRGRRGRRLLHRTGEVLDYTPAEPGRSVRLTLDIELQQAIEREVLDVHAENGAAVVIHVPTGQVLVLASKPRYDLNSYRYRAEVKKLLTDETNLPLTHRAVAMGYPPGSTVKPLVALSAAANGVLSPDQAIECRGYLHSPEVPFFRCWIYKAH